MTSRVHLQGRNVYNLFVRNIFANKGSSISQSGTIFTDISAKTL